MASESGTLANLIEPNRKRPECVVRMRIDRMRIVHMRNDPISEEVEPCRVVVAVSGGGEQVSGHDLTSCLSGTVSNIENEALRLPADAGKYRDALTTVLLRIPAGWSKSISCGPGWYPLIARVHLELCALDIDYEVFQVRQKYGSLRYRAQPQIDDIRIHKMFVDVLSQAESASVHICELCGDSGNMSVSERGGMDWYRPLCRDCRAMSAASILIASVGATAVTRPVGRRAKNASAQRDWVGRQE